MARKKHRVKVEEGKPRRIGDRIVTVRRSRGLRYVVQIEREENPGIRIDKARTCGN